MTIKNKFQCAANLLPKDELSNRILYERAERLAKHHIDEAMKTETHAYIRFSLGKNEYYGISYPFAKEVMNNVVITKLPHVPNYVAGISNRRGTLITIVDLKRFFHLQNSNYSKNSYVIVVSENDMTVGILADNIEDGDAFDPVTLEVPIASNNIIKPQYIMGLHNGMTAIINVDAILSDIRAELEKIGE